MRVVICALNYDLQVGLNSLIICMISQYILVYLVGRYETIHTQHTCFKLHIMTNITLYKCILLCLHIIVQRAVGNVNACVYGVGGVGETL